MPGHVRMSRRGKNPCDGPGRRHCGPVPRCDQPSSSAYGTPGRRQAECGAEGGDRQDQLRAASPDPSARPWADSACRSRTIGRRTGKNVRTSRPPCAKECRGPRHARFTQCAGSRLSCTPPRREGMVCLCHPDASRAPGAVLRRSGRSAYAADGRSHSRQAVHEDVAYTGGQESTIGMPGNRRLRRRSRCPHPPGEARHRLPKTVCLAVTSRLVRTRLLMTVLGNPREHGERGVRSDR